LNQPSRSRLSRSPSKKSRNRSPSQSQNHDDVDLLPESVRQYLADHDGHSGEEPDTTGTLESLTEASPQDWLGSNQDPDVLLSVPSLSVDHIGLDVDNLHARVDLHARVLDLVELRVGADVTIEDVQLDIDNVEAQAMLKVKLDKVYDIISETVDLLRDNPGILTELADGVARELESEPEQSIEARAYERDDRSEYG
jgi:hypothetical protein